MNSANISVDVGSPKMIGQRNDLHTGLLTDRL